MMHFDRYNNRSDNADLIEDSIQSIKLESERLRILANQKGNKKILIFFDNEIRDHKMLLSYFKSNDCDKVTAIDPYLHFDLHYTNARAKLSASDLSVLHDFIDDFLLTNIKSSKSPEEKESDKEQSHRR